MRRFLQFTLPFVMIAICLSIAYLIVKSKKSPKKKERAQAMIVVDVQKAKAVNYQMKVNTQGVVQAKLRGQLSSEVSGKIIKTSDKLFAGFFFKKGDVLAEIDSRDFEIAKTKAAATVVRVEYNYQQELVRSKAFDAAIKKAENSVEEAKLALIQENARVDQALADWQKLGLEGEPSELLLRKPQLRAAQARVDSAEAELEIKKAEKNLSGAMLQSAKATIQSAKADLSQRTIDLARCLIKAPYDGRVMSVNVALGEYINRGTVLAKIYGIESNVVRLPVSEQQMNFLNLSHDRESQAKTVVEFLSVNDTSKGLWKGEVERLESEIDSKSRQQFIIARVDQPFSGEKAFQPGLFVKAQITGKLLKNVYILPQTAIRESRYVWLVNDQSKLEKKHIEILWRDQKMVIVKADFVESSRICTTALSYAKENLVVEVKGKAKGRQKGEKHAEPKGKI